MLQRLLFVCSLFFIFLGSCLAENKLNQVPTFENLVDSYFNTYFSFNPIEATIAGLHIYDHCLTSYTSTSISRQVVAYKNLLSELQQFPTKGLNAINKADREWLIHIIKSNLLDLQEIRLWQKDPDSYASQAVLGVFLINRDYAPKKIRLQSVIARELEIPRFLQEARKNLINPPRIYTDIALEQICGSIQFFEKDLPQAFADVNDKALLQQFKFSNTKAIKSLKAYQVWLSKDLLPISQGDFRLGAAIFSKKLAYEEMVALPLPQLLTIGYADLRRNQSQLNIIAKQMGSTPQAVLAQLGKDHPKPQALLANFKTAMFDARHFIEAHNIIGIPNQRYPIIAETPPFARALTFASMEVPGPLERQAKESYFYVTLPESTWVPAKVEEHMAAFNRGTIVATAIHEVFPGHYLQYLWAPAFPSKLRQMIYANANVEGWAHYCEQMMVEEGYRKNDPLVRLGQLQDALLRNARYIVGIEMHTGKMSYQQGIDFFMQQAYQTHANAERETKRGTSDPTYLVYTLGKLQILQLRADYKKLKGNKFTLREFHDNLMRQGYVPLTIARQAMLSNATLH